jgi:hypothetical protein
MTKLIHNSNDPMLGQIRKLEIAFKWEFRPVFIGLVGWPLWFYNPDLVLVIGGAIFSLIWLVDVAFSAIVTRIFLKPLFHVMNGADDAVRSQSAGYKRMRQTIRMTLAGSSLAMLSSTALYANTLAFIVMGPDSMFYSSPFLHVLSFGVNLDSVLNAIAMLLASGIFRDLSIGPAIKWLKSRGTPASKSAPVASTFEFNSRAYEQSSVRPTEL